MPTININDKQVIDDLLNTDEYLINQLTTIENDQITLINDVDDIKLEQIT